jgi:hypothetical protein
VRDSSEKYFESQEYLGTPALAETSVTPKPDTPQPVAAQGPSAPSPGSYMRLRALATVEPRRIEWLVDGQIPLGTLTLVAGRGGLGKSTWLAAVASRASRGGLGDVPPCDVILVSFEDPTPEVVRPRLEAAGADLTRIHDVVFESDSIETLQLPRDVSDLEELVVEVGARLIVIDPIVAGIEMSFDTHKDQHVRAVLSQLAQLAERQTCSIVLVAHLNKNASSDAFTRIGGSGAFWNACRSVITVSEDPEQPDDHRLIAQQKANWTRHGIIERHRIDELVLGTRDAASGKSIITSRMVFVEIADNVDLADLLAPPQRRDGKIELAETFLSEALSDGRWQDSAEIKRLASSAGINERTLKRAAAELVEAARKGFPSSTTWRLRESRQTFPDAVGPTGAPQQASPLSLAAGPLGPTVSTAQQVGPTLSPPAITVIGDDWYPVLLARAADAGHVLGREFTTRLALHNAVAARAASE